MIITHIIIGLGIGGAELMLKRLAKELNGKDGYTHSVIALKKFGAVEQELRENGIDVKLIGMSNALSIPITFFRLRHELKKQKPDIVQTWMYHADFLGGLAAKSLGINNIIWGIRTTDVTLGRSKVTILLRKLCAWLSYSVPKFVVCAADAGRKVHEQVGYDPSKMRVIPNGFDLDKLKATPEQRKELREAYGFTDEHVVIGSVGRFNPIKNQKIFIETAALIAPKFKNTRFMMVGRDNNWENTVLVSWIAQHNLQDKFILLGERSDIPICLSSMDIFCLHSKTEGFPNVLGEAMAMGLLCIATDVGDSSMLLENDNFIVVNSKEGISNGIIKLLKYNNEEIELISNRMKRIIENKYTINKTVKFYSDVYIESK